MNINSTVIEKDEETKLELFHFLFLKDFLINF